MKKSFFHPEETNEEEKVISEINITPLTDLFLVLLIIFIVAVPFIHRHGMKIKLPSSQTAKPYSKDNLTVVLTKDNKIRLEGKEISFEKLQSELKKELDKLSNKTVILKGDREVIFGNAVAIMDIAKLAGAKKIAIATSTAKPTFQVDTSVLDKKIIKQEPGSAREGK